MGTLALHTVVFFTVIVQQVETKFSARGRMQIFMNFEVFHICVCIRFVSKYSHTPNASDQAYRLPQ